MNINMNDVWKEVTDDWVECFSKPENQSGFMWRMAAQEILPEGVDINDDRVQSLCDLAKEQTSK